MCHHPRRETDDFLIIKEEKSSRNIVLYNFCPYMLMLDKIIWNTQKKMSKEVNYQINFVSDSFKDFSHFLDQNEMNTQNWNQLGILAGTSPRVDSEKGPELVCTLCV